MAQTHDHGELSEAWRSAARAALRVAFGIIWAVDAALAWTPGFAANYVGYLHNAAHGQPGWSAFWFDMWIALVTPRAALFIWLTRIAVTVTAFALILGLGRKTLYAAGALFSLLVWSTAEGFGGPYTVGATNMGAAIAYVLIFIALIAINTNSGPSPYSLDYYIEKRWPFWLRIAEWRMEAPPSVVHPLSWRIQGPSLLGIALVLFFLIGGLHSTLNVKAPSPEAAAAAVSPLSLAAQTPIPTFRDARLPPLTPGPIVKIHFVVTDHRVEIANGVYYQAWTYNGTVPGPFVHVRQGQTVEVTLTNHGTMPHSIDFHAAEVAPNKDFIDIKPGQSLHFSFVANVPGAFVYHCETMPILLHVGNGMYGALIVSPDKPLPPAAESYVLVQSEWYTQQISGTLMGPNYEKMLKEQPDEVVFNGTAFQYVAHPLPAKVGQRIRIYFVDAGPNLWTSFHVIGAVFDKVYPDGDAANALSDVSTYSVGPGGGAVLDLVITQAGKYSFVDHVMDHIMIGAHGVLDVLGPGQTAAVPSTAVSSSPSPASSASAAPAPAVPPAAAATGPYKFDPARGEALYTANCAVCHQASGLGLPGAFPPLKGNAAVLDANPTKQIDVVLHGLHGENVGGTVYPGAMPPFGGALNDVAIANIINHERSSWGNHSKLIKPKQVAKMRAKSHGK